MNPTVLHLSFDDFDALSAAARGWDLDLRPLSRGPFNSGLVQAVTKNAMFAYAQFGGHLRQTGSAPPGYRTFGIPAQAGLRFQWRGSKVLGNQIILFPPGGELHCFSRPDFEIFTLSLTEGCLEAIAYEQGIAGSRRLFEGGVLNCDPAAVDRLRTDLANINCRLTHESAHSSLGQPVETLESRLAHSLVEVAATSLRRTDRGTRRRERALWRVESSLAENTRRRLSIRDLSLTAGVSVRTLELLFREELGVSPKRYLRAYRLNNVRRTLQNANGRPVAIGEIADRWGFTHLSQFAADYRELFGERPSETLASN